MSKEKINELEERIKKAIENRDKYQKEIVDAHKDLEKLKAGELEEALKTAEWRYHEDTYPFMDVSHQRWHLYTHSNKLKTHIKNSPYHSCTLLPNCIMLIDGYGSTPSIFPNQDSDKIIIRFYNNDISNLHSVIKKYELNVDFTYAEKMKKHFDMVLNNDRT